MLCIRRILKIPKAWDQVARPRAQQTECHFWIFLKLLKRGEVHVKQVWSCTLQQVCLKTRRAPESEPKAVKSILCRIRLDLTLRKQTCDMNFRNMNTPNQSAASLPHCQSQQALRTPLPPEVNPLQLATLGRCSRPAFGQPHWHLLFCEPWQSKPCNSHSNCGLHKSRMKIKWLNQPKESVRSGPKKKSFTTVVSRPLSIWELAWLLADRPRRIDRERFQRQCDRHDAIPPPHLRTQLGANWTHYDIQNINSSAASARALGWVLRANDCS